MLVANAALPAAGRLDSFTAQEIDRALDVNLRAPMQLTRALVPAMVERGTGHVVLISSLSGKVASAGASIYSATKFGLRGFGFSLNEELRGTGVGVTTVFPGLHPRRRHVRTTPAWSCQRASAPAGRTTWRAP